MSASFNNYIRNKRSLLIRKYPRIPQLATVDVELFGKNRIAYLFTRKKKTKTTTFIDRLRCVDNDWRLRLCVVL